MPLISLEQAEAGMTVAEDVLDRRGRVLVPQGADLSQRVLEALEGWGVESLFIEGDAAPEPHLDPIDVAAAKAELADRFSRTDVDHPFVMAILERAAKARVRSGLHGSSSSSRPTEASDVS